jgi:hypothetical protein
MYVNGQLKFETGNSQLVRGSPTGILQRIRRTTWNRFSSAMTRLPRLPIRHRSSRSPTRQCWSARPTLLGIDGIDPSGGPLTYDFGRNSNLPGDVTDDQQEHPDGG